MSMKFPDRVKETTATTGTGAFALSGAASGFRSFAAGLVVGDTVPYCAVLGAEFEVGVGTLTAASTLARTTVTASSNTGALVNFSAGAKEIFATVSGTQVTGFLTQESMATLGTPLTTFLAANPGNTLGGADLLATAQGNGLKGIPASGFAEYVLSTFATGHDVVVPIATTAPFPLDFTSHNRRRLLCTAAATINAPTLFATVGNDFACLITNVSGAAVTLGTGIVGLPSGSTIANGATADVFTSGGIIYAQLASAAVFTGTAPGQVTGLSLSLPTSGGLTASWTAPSTGTAPFGYTVQYRVTGAGSWTTAAIGVSATSYAINGLSPSTSYDVQVVATNGGGPGVYSASATASTAAGLPAPGQVTNLAAGTPTSTTVPLTWTAASGTVTGNTVEKSVNSGTSWTQVATGVTGTSYTATALPSATAHLFRVTAYNGTGNGTPSATASATTAAAPAVTVSMSNSFAGFPATINSFSGNSYFQTLSLSGATAASMEFALIESATAYPAGALDGTTTPRGKKATAIKNGSNAAIWEASPALSLGFNVGATNIPFYFWAKLTDTNGVVYYFRRATAIQIGDGASLVGEGATVSTPRAYPA